MGILEEIREYFASTQNGAREIKTLPKEYSAMVIRDNEGYGVAIEFDDIRDISEKFANSRLFSRTLAIGGIEKKYLILSCMLSHLDTCQSVIQLLCIWSHLFHSTWEADFLAVVVNLSNWRDNCSCTTQTTLCEILNLIEVNLSVLHLHAKVLLRNLRDPEFPDKTYLLWQSPSPRQA